MIRPPPRSTLFPSPPLSRSARPTCCTWRRARRAATARRTTAQPPSGCARPSAFCGRSEEHTSELQSQSNLVCRLLLEKKNKTSEQYDFNYFLSHHANLAFAG